MGAFVFFGILAIVLVVAREPIKRFFKRVAGLFLVMPESDCACECVFVLGEQPPTDAPVEIITGDLRKMRGSGPMLAYLSLQSLCDQPIDRVTVGLICTDSAAVAVGEPILYEYCNAAPEGGAFFGSTEPIAVADPTVTAYEARILRVVFADGSEWTSKDAARMSGEVQRADANATLVKVKRKANSGNGRWPQIALITLCALIACTALGYFVAYPLVARALGNYAPYVNMYNVESITIGSGRTEIKEYAFKNCDSLRSVTIPDTVTNIGMKAFYDCDALESVVIPGSVKEISFGAFEACNGLESVTLGDGVEVIGTEAFYGCTNLRDLVIPTSVRTLGDNAFSSCPIENATIPLLAVPAVSKDYLKTLVINGEGTIGKRIFLDFDQLESVTIGEGVISIGSYAFSGCERLESVTLPSSLKTIRSNAFGACKSLKSITIPDGVTYVDEYAFMSTPIETMTAPVNAISGFPRGRLKSVVLTGEGSIPYNAFSEALYLESIVISEGVTSIEEYAFSNCTGLTSIVIPDSVTSIGYWAFRGCNKLTSIVIPGSVTSIGYDAFEGCTGLTSITLGDGVTSIGGYAFGGCTSLESLEIPDSVTSIGYNAFEGCTGLTSIVIPDSVTSIGYDAFDGCSALSDVYFTGSEAEWRAISAVGGNYNLTSATIHYNYVPDGE